MLVSPDGFSKIKQIPAYFNKICLPSLIKDKGLIGFFIRFEINSKVSSPRDLALLRFALFNHNLVLRFKLWFSPYSTSIISSVCVNPLNLNLSPIVNHSNHLASPHKGR